MRSKIYNPFSDSDPHRKNIEACITVIENIQEDIGTNEANKVALGIWNEILRHKCIPGRMDTFWQMALEHEITNCRVGNDKICPSYKALLSIYLLETSIGNENLKKVV